MKLVFANDAAGRRVGAALIGVDGSRVELARYAYDALGRMSAAECAFGMSVRYEWHQSKPLVTRWRNKTGRSATSFAYDEQGRVVHTRTTGLWDEDRFAYDGAKRVTTYLPAGDPARAQQFEYDAHENVTAEIDALGGATRHAFNKLGFKTATTDANGASTKTAYDIFGNVKSYKDAEGRETIYGWGPEGQLDIVIDGAGALRRNEYDERANVVAEIDAENNRTKHQRDARGRIVRTVFADGAEERRAYDERGWLSGVRDAKGGVTRFAYDAFGRMTARTDALGRTTTFAYAAGAGGFATPTRVTRPDGSSVGRDFDAEGQIASVTDGEGRTWRYQYGAFDVLEAIVDPLGGRLDLAYDSEGRLTSVTNALGCVYELERDLAGRIVAEQDFDKRRTLYKRDPGGRVIETIKPDGARIVYGYDKSDKIVKIESFAPGARASSEPQDSVSFSYDGRGLLAYAKNNAGFVETIRDKNGRIVEEDVDGRRVKSRYDAMGRRIERRAFSGIDQPHETRIGERLTRYVRDPLGQLESLFIGEQAAMSFSRDALGREVGRSSVAGLRLEQSFDEVGRLSEQRGPSLRRRFAWDRADGLVGVRGGPLGDVRYAHDARGQIVRAEFGGEGPAAAFAENFAYDAAQNVEASGATPGGAAFAALERPGLTIDKRFPVEAARTGWLRSDGGVVALARGPHGEKIALTHDACGRVVKRRVERAGFRPQEWDYQWDAFGRLAACETPEGKRWLYGYDPFGRRLWKRQAEPRYGEHEIGRAYGWDGDALIEDAPIRPDGSIDWAAAVTWHYDDASFRPLAREQGGALHHVVTDHLGAPKELTDEAGRLVLAMDFTVWGAVRRCEPPANDNAEFLSSGARAGPARVAGALALKPEALEQFCPLRFPGQWADEETGLYYNRHRHYDPLVGQYASPDPIGLWGGVRPQGYVGDPTGSVDPFGLRLAANAAKGRAWEKTVADDFRSQGFDVFEQITVRDAQSGRAIRLDGVVVKDGKIVQVYDAKASATAPLTPNQTVAYPNIDAGGQVIPMGGNAAAVPGMTPGVPMTLPGPVSIIRP